MIPQLEQASYERQQGGLNALMDLDNSMYGRFSDDEARKLQSLQFALDVAGFNEGNNQFAANYGLDVAGFNEGNKQFAANYNLDKYRANQDERHFAYNTKADNMTTAVGMMSGYQNYKQLVNGNKGGSGGGGGRRRSSIGGGGGVGGYTSTPTTTTDTYTKATQIADKKKKPTIKGTASGGGKLHNTQQYR